MSNINNLLSEIATYFRVNLEKSLADLGLHYGQVFLLQLLHENDGISQADIYRQLSIAAPTVNKMVKSLEKSGFVKCRRCSTDTRRVRVFLTEKGRQIKSQIDAQFSKIENESLSGFSETEKIMLNILLEKLRDNLKRIRFSNDFFLSQTDDKSD
jgi:DNA-binding MarR family transcriptional regulator